MIKGLFGANTVPYALRQGLDTSMRTHKGIADRVAVAVEKSTQNDPTGENPQDPDLTRDMASLADVQLRYEAEARLLRTIYQTLRTSIRGNG